MNSDIHLIKTLEVGNELGEGVIWDHARQCVWWTDIPNTTLYHYSLDSDTLTKYPTPERLCCLTPVENDKRLLCAFASGFAFFEPDSGELKWIKKIEEDNPGTRLNDGKTDRYGRFWVGTMVEDREQATDKGKLYCVDHDLAISEHLTELSITNSLCWSPDGAIAYHTDTPTRRINRYQSSLQPGLSPATLLVKTKRGAYPDGSCVDNQGHLWNAQWGASQIVRYTPEGSESLVISMPTAQPTCPSFAGANLDKLIVTSAYADMDAEQRALDPQAGHVFIYETPFTGIADLPFRLNA
jgi:sugar lactone lactonase YvrE